MTRTLARPTACLGRDQTNAARALLTLTRETTSDEHRRGTAEESEVSTVATYLVSRTAVMVLSGLTMGLTFAHVLELPQRLQFDAELWFALTKPNALYRYFGVVGGPIEVAAVLGAGILAVVLRHQRAAGRLALAAALFHAAALAAWATIVAPANTAIGEWDRSGIPRDWELWRIRWESGHTLGFALLTVGFCLLVLTLLHQHRERRDL
jgi:hypothetical protein